MCYTLKGRHPFHPDGVYRGFYRIILTLGANGKWMWFRKGKTNDVDEMVGLELDHGMAVTMSKEGGGSIGVEHAALGDATGSWFIGLEIDLNEEEMAKFKRALEERRRVQGREDDEDEEKKEDE